MEQNLFVCLEKKFLHFLTNMVLGYSQKKIMSIMSCLRNEYTTGVNLTVIDVYNFEIN